MQQDFTLGDENAAVVSAICRRPRRTPAGHRLAAARIKVLPPRALLARLERRLPLLTGGGRDLPARQQTMRDTIGWSYDLLSRPEQTLFRRLAVFVGGCTLEAAESVANAFGHFGMSVLEGVAPLIDNSLLRQDAGLERLVDSGEEPVTCQAHADWFVAFAEQSWTGLTPSFAPDWLSLAEADHNNARAALG